ncbi:hypothetical protein QYE76_044056 [Lolium multiflorum]|uniref:Uncharacterized protein n=1 Tax=Lolium multiflorum TaxID=4521 RepID=A0AAD8WYR7_LOLMU|nr:hypothetical protein QYE76_043865 [Lolium multiflorum]KAK1683208.1 hypothetical protein QYE76_044056 [Lolium multiflorum]
MRACSSSALLLVFNCGVNARQRLPRPLYKPPRASLAASFHLSSPLQASKPPPRCPPPALDAMYHQEPLEAAPSRSRRNFSSRGALAIRDPSPPRQREWTPPPE